MFVMEHRPNIKPTMQKAVIECYGFTYLRQDPARKLVGGARNQAVSMGSNPYLAFLDGDDYWYDGYLSEVKTSIEKSNSKKPLFGRLLLTVNIL